MNFMDCLLKVRNTDEVFEVVIQGEKWFMTSVEKLIWDYTVCTSLQLFACASTWSWKLVVKIGEEEMWANLVLVLRQSVVKLLPWVVLPPPFYLKQVGFCRGAWSGLNLFIYLWLHWSWDGLVAQSGFVEKASTDGREKVWMKRA